MTIVAIILAAGSSARMGQPKQLLDWHGQPLVRVVAQQTLASQVDGVYAVLGAAGEQVAAALAELPITIVTNQAFASGQASSLRAGIAALPNDVAAVLVLLGDQPFVTPEIIDRLIAAWRETNAPIVAPNYNRQRGNPVLFSQAIFPELLAIQGDQGARTILQADPTRMHLVDFPTTRPLDDIDSPEDYERVVQSEFRMNNAER